MNITIEARALSVKSGGVRSYTHELIKHILTNHPEDSIEVLYGSKGALGTFVQAQETLIPLPSDILLSYWMSFQVTRHIKNTNPAVVHFTKAALPHTKHAPSIVTLYDIIPVLLPETQSPLRRLYWPYALEHAAKNADHIMTISEKSKQDIMEHYGTPEDKITVTPLAVDLEHFRPVGKTLGVNAKTPSVEDAGSPYILFVGTWDQRKNISSLIRAFEMIADKIPHSLVIAGRPADKADDSKKTAQKSVYAKRIEFRENIPYSQLPALYSNADIFVWPSIYEGWGFPPQEAMACGTPVIVSNGGPLPEVVGDAGIIVPFSAKNLYERTHDATFIEHLSYEMLSLLQDDTKKQELIRRGLERVKTFSWNDVAEKTYSAYKKIAV